MLRQILFGGVYNRTYSKYFIIATIAIASIIINSSKVALASKSNEHFSILKHNRLQPEQELEFIKKDKEYLSNMNKKDNSLLNEEIGQLEKDLNTVKDDYITTKNNLKVYTGNTALKNNALRVAIVNRKNLINTGSSFNYDDKSKYMIERGFDKEIRTRGNFTGKDLDLALLSMIEVLENLEIDTSFLSKTSFVVSPYKIDGINGYTVTRSDGYHTVVISKQTAFAPETWTVKNIKSTTLHEIGHVFYNNKNIAKLSNGLVSKYSVSNLETTGSLNMKTWKESPTENFAEDFKMFAANKLGSSSFEPTKKQTSQAYDASSFLKLMETVY